MLMCRPPSWTACAPLFALLGRQRVTPRQQPSYMSASKPLAPLLQFVFPPFSASLITFPFFTQMFHRRLFLKRGNPRARARHAERQKFTTRATQTLSDVFFLTYLFILIVVLWSRYWPLPSIKGSESYYSHTVKTTTGGGVKMQREALRRRDVFQQQWVAGWHLNICSLILASAKVWRFITFRFFSPRHISYRSGVFFLFFQSDQSSESTLKKKIFLHSQPARVFFFFHLWVAVVFLHKGFRNRV